MSSFRDLLAISTSIFSGYSLETALEQIAKTGLKRVEIAAIVGIAEHISQEEVNSEKAAQVRKLLANCGLQSTAFSAHYYLHKSDAVDVFVPRMEFARAVGATIINTKAGPIGHKDSFYRNMEVLVRRAEALDMVIGLETHGDIVNYGLEAVDVIRQFGTSHVLLNYDFGNVLINSGGKVDPAADFCGIINSIGHIHIKDAKIIQGFWEMCTIGQGVVDFAKVFRAIRGGKTTIPSTIEIPLRLRLDSNAKLTIRDEIPTLSRIAEVLEASINYIDRQTL